MSKKLHILSTGVLANDPLIEWGAENLRAGTVHQSFLADWTIVTHNEERAEKCVHQARSAPLDVTVMIDEESRTDRTSATRRAILELPKGELVWMFPEGLIPCPQAGLKMREAIESSGMIAYEGEKCGGLDHIVFERPSDDIFENKCLYVNNIFSNGSQSLQNNLRDDFSTCGQQYKTGSIIIIIILVLIILLLTYLYFKKN